MAFGRFIDELNDTVTVWFEGSGLCITFGGRMVREYGLTTLMTEYGMGDRLPTERLPVFQGDRKIGTMAPEFDPMFIKSRSFMYEPRRGDFVREGEGWRAANNLGPGDFEAIPGFVWERA